MTLSHFFEETGSFLTGERSFEQFATALGPLPSRREDYLFYVHLLEHDQARILAELYPAVRAWVDRQGLSWPVLCRAFLSEHPPRGFSVPHVGEGFADWLSTARGREPKLPIGIEAVADLTWTRFLARTAPDVPGLGLDQRLFVRHYPIDAAATARAAIDGGALPEPTPSTLLVYRCFVRGTVRELRASRATIAVLLEESRAAVPDPLRLSESESATERQRLTQHGVLAATTTQEE